MGKYDPLKTFLLAAGAEEVPMTFAEIESVIGASLPQSQRFPAWWSNNPWNNVMTEVWLDAGYRTERVDIAGRRVVFRRVSDTEATPPSDRNSPRRGRHPAWGAMRGTVRIAPGVDLTEPLHEPWGGEEW
ncbi:MAG TPA: hypothetical protein VF459_12265 [Caulobacteraceae bacterium]